MQWAEEEQGVYNFVLSPKPRMTKALRGGLCLKQLPHLFKMKYTPLKKGCLNCNTHLGWKKWNAGIRFCCTNCKDSFGNQYYGNTGKRRLKNKGVAK